MDQGSPADDSSLPAAGKRKVARPVVLARVRPPRSPSLRRERLDRKLEAVFRHRLTLIIAPAGAGKTTLLAQFAASADAPVAWYRAENGDRDEVTLLRHLRAGFESALGPLPGPWMVVEEAAVALESWSGPRAVLAIDDLHALEGSEAEAALERLLDYLPASLTVLAATRSAPQFNLSRLRVSGELLELSGDDLRFRSWEVEHLFRDLYNEPLPPENLAELARRTEGWAAGLQLFHLATRGKPADERQRTLAALGSRMRLVDEYLTRNVLGGLPDGLRDFLVTTCVFGRLEAQLCDRLRGAPNSRQMLEELERRQVFTQQMGDGAFRYHEVLRTHLEQMLIEKVGERRAHDAYRRAGRILEQAAHPAEAVRAYCRAEDWEAVDRLLGRQGEQIAAASSGWIDALPVAMLHHDPWVRLGTARRHRAAGQWSAAVASYLVAERAFGNAESGVACREERLAVQAWLDHEGPPRTAGGWSSIVRAGVSREPLILRGEAARLPLPEGGLATGLLELLAGHLADASATLRAVAGTVGAGHLALGARVALGSAMLLRADSRGASEIENALEEADRQGLAWLARIARAALALDRRPGGSSDAAAVAMACDREGDVWGAILAGLLQGIAATMQGENPAEHLAHVASRCRGMGAGVLEAWARGYMALGLARADAPGSRDAALQAEAFARSSGTRVPQAVAYLALSLATPDNRELRELAIAIAAESGLALPEAPPPVGTSVSVEPVVDTPPESLRMRCFGGFAIDVAGRPVNLGIVKPRVRALLRLFALYAGKPVHREVLQEALWPESDRETGVRNLHVAISALRQLLEPGVARGGSEFIVRDGEAYRLALPEGARLDLLDFGKALNQGRETRARRDLHGAAAAFGTALALHSGELLPEDGPADWVVERREQCRAGAVEAAQALAETSLELGDAAEAARACSAGLVIDRYSDALWKLFAVAHEGLGDPAAASRARLAYNQVLGELGVKPEPTTAVRG